MDATIKEFKRDQAGRSWLIPRNPADQQPISADNATILGKVVTVIRMLRLDRRREARNSP